MYWFCRYNLVCCPRRTVKLGFTDIVLFSVRFKFAAGKLGEKYWRKPFGEVSTSLRVQGKAPSERREYLPTGIGNISLRAEGMSPYGRRETLPSNGAYISLQAGRVSRFGRGVQLASGGASNSLRAGRVIRFERGEQLASGGASNSLRAGRTGRLGFTDITLSLSASSFPYRKTW